jgi:hypothetical protein
MLFIVDASLLVAIYVHSEICSMYMYNRKVAGSIPDDVIGIFHWHYLFRPHYGPGVDSASKRNEYQEYFLEIKEAGA